MAHNLKKRYFVHKTINRPYKPFHKLPKSKLSLKERQKIALQIEKSKMKRDKSVVILNRGLIVYFCIILMAVFGFVNNYLSRITLNVLIISAVLILTAASMPFIASMYRDEKDIEDMIKNLSERK